MLMQRLSDYQLKIALIGAAALVMILALAACNSDGPDRSGPPGPDETQVFEPGFGAGPVHALATYLDANDLDGHTLQTGMLADCMIRDFTRTPVTGTPPAMARVALGQFCIDVRDLVHDESARLVIQLPDTGETWEAAVRWDADGFRWELTDINRISD